MLYEQWGKWSHLIRKCYLCTKLLFQHCHANQGDTHIFAHWRIHVWYLYIEYIFVGGKSSWKVIRSKATSNLKIQQVETFLLCTSQVSAPASVSSRRRYKWGRESNSESKLTEAKERKGKPGIEMGRISNIDLWANCRWAPRVLCNLFDNSNSKWHEYCNTDGTEYMGCREGISSDQDPGQRKLVLTVKLDQERDGDIYRKVPKGLTDSLIQTNCRLTSELNCMFFIIYCLIMFKLFYELWIIHFSVRLNSFWVFLLLSSLSPEVTIPLFQC